MPLNAKERNSAYQRVRQRAYRRLATIHAREFQRLLDHFKRLDGWREEKVRRVP